jgi:hypothetical protein
MPNLYHYQPETNDMYATIQIEMLVVDDNGDEYTRDFTVINTPEGLAIVCPDCGEYLQINEDCEYECAQGHLAYRIENHEEPDNTINDCFAEAVKAYKNHE